MVKQTFSNNKKILQQQVSRLNNEIEELRLEREESKKNVLHFMQEADAAKQELRKAQELLDEMTSSCPGLQSPPPEKEHEEMGACQQQKPKLSILLSKISLFSDAQIAELFQLLEDPHQVTNLKLSLSKLQTELNEQKSENALLRDELDQITQEYQATRGALQIENERAEIIEKRWKESENHLEQAEYTVQVLNKDLDYYRQQEWALTTPDNSLSEKLSALEMQQAENEEQIVLLQSCLDEQERITKSWKEKYNELSVLHSSMENKQIEIDAAKMKENHLKTVIKSLRDEIRKLHKVEDDIINIEYLRNVIIKFLEKRNTRAQLVPILSTLLQCSNDDQARLRKLIRTNNNSNSRIRA